MQRRQLLKNIGVLGGAMALPTTMTSLAKAITPESLSTQISTQVGTPVNIKALFNNALESNPKLIGFSNVERNFLPKTLTVEGTIPKDLEGIFYRNGPGKHERGDIRYKHLFEGDGMLQRFVISDGKISHEGKFIQTPKFTQEEQAEQFFILWT